MPHRFRRWPGATSSRSNRRPFRPFVQELEDRRLPAAPVIDPVQVPLNIPAGKTLIVPLTAADPDGGTVTYTVSSSNPNVHVLTHPGNTFLDVTVAGFGDLEFELFNDLTPRTAALIAGFAKAEFYDGLTFHRVVKGFMIQGGDPAGNGTGGPGFQSDQELNTQALFSGSGQLALANSGPDTDGSQFFITDGPQRFLDLSYTLFGQLVRGFDVLRAIENVPVTRQNPSDPNSEVSKPVTPVVITGARVVRDSTDAVFTLESTGAAPDSTTLTVTATSSTGGTTITTLQAQVVADRDGQGNPVNDPPILGPVSDQLSAVRTPITIHLTRADPENDASDYGAAVAQADAAHATVSTPVVNPDGSADIAVTPSPGFTGVVHVVVGVKEHGATSRGSSSYPWDTQVIAVTFGDQALAAQPGPGVNATEGAPAAGVTLATFTDADPNAVAGDFQVSINWGDGTPPDTTTGQVTGGNGQFNVTGSHTYREAGTYPVRVVVTDVHQSTPGGDNGGATATATVTATVADAPLSAGQGVAVTGTAGTLLNQVPVASFTDADPNARPGDYVVTIDWGDGSVSPGTVAVGAGGLQVLGSHVYAAPGQYGVGVSVTDVNTAGDAIAATTSAQTTAVIQPAPPPPAPPRPPQPLPPRRRHRHRRRRVHHPRHHGPKHQP